LPPADGAHSAIFRALGTVSSAVEHLSLKHGMTIWSGASGKDNPVLWDELLGSFSSVKSLYMDDEVVEEISRSSLQSDDGDFHTELFPKAKELSYFAGLIHNDLGEVLTAFIDALHNACRLVTLLRFDFELTSFASRRLTSPP
jgi:hypothetical protein